MASLKDLRNRIRSVQSTRKITSAMKVVAASRLKKAQDAAEASRPYAVRMERMLSSLAQSMVGLPTAPALLAGTGKADTHLVIIATSDRGLAGGFNAVILREARRQIRALLAEGKTVKIMTVGRKGRDAVKREYPKLLIDSVTDIGRKGVHFSEAKSVSEAVLARFEAGEFDVATIIFAKFKSAISQIVTVQQLIPFGAPAAAAPADDVAGAIYEFEPSEEDILTELLPNNVGVQIFTALLENAASEHGSRMTAMDNATRNAGDMIKGLTLVYNRTRQATITKELIEIISGAEAL